MVTTTTRLVTSPPVKPVHKIAWTEFQAKYLTREDRYNYEWVDGIVEKTPRTMDKSQLFIVDNLVGEDLCSAASVIEGFVLPVKEVLK